MDEPEDLANVTVLSTPSDPDWLHKLHRSVIEEEEKKKKPFHEGFLFSHQLSNLTANARETEIPKLRAFAHAAGTKCSTTEGKIHSQILP